MNENRHCDAVDGLDRQRRLAWAKYYDEHQRAETLAEILEDLVYLILHKRNAEVFKKAKQIDDIIQKFKDKEKKKAG